MYLHYVALDCVHESDFIMEKPNGLTDYLLLYIKSPSTMIVDDRIFTIAAPSIILFSSYTPHRYFPTGTEYIDDYLHFAIKDRANFLDELTFPLNTPIKISNDKYITPLLHDILNEDGKEGKYSSRIIDYLVNLLLLRIGEQWDLLQHKDNAIPHYDDLLAVRNQIMRNPSKNWNIEELAEQAHLSHAYFQVMYKKAFGVTCITDVINVKTAQAKVLLSSTDLPVKQVAEELGYNEIYHFIRQFKKNTGLTPGAFRKKVTVP